jgi:hypothetical protein
MYDHILSSKYIYGRQHTVRYSLWNSLVLLAKQSSIGLKLGRNRSVNLLWTGTSSDILLEDGLKW